MKTILVVFGTRPEAIKLLPVIHELKKPETKLNVKVCVTAQHREMLDQVLKLFNVIPDYDLNIMKKNQSLSDLTQRILKEIEQVIIESKPDYLMVQGDTTTTFATSLVAFYHQIKILHIEAGLRTNNKFSPFPEEINRRLTSALTDYHFVPTQVAKDNLLQENYPEDKILITGNTVIDALFYTLNKLKSKKLSINGLEEIDWTKKLILITGHRRENFGEGFKNICNAIKIIAERYTKINIVYPVHLNPNVRSVVFEMLSQNKNIFLINPVEYEQFVYLMKKCYLILTDSGGVQEEAPALGKPVIVMRDTTERPEIITEGAGKLVGTNTEKIVKQVSKLLDNSREYNKLAISRNIYGDGTASKQISHAIQGKQI